MSQIINPGMMELVRHGESLSQWMRRVRKLPYEGDENPPLVERGRRQAWEAGYARRNTPQPDVVLCSGLDRAYETADIFLQAAGWTTMPIEPDQAFNEQSYGDIRHLMTDAELREKSPDLAFMRLQQGFWFFRPPGGESWLDIYNRLQPAWEKVRSKYSGKHVMLFGHQCSNQVLRMLIEDLTIAELLSIDMRLSTNCAVTTYEQERTPDSTGKLRLVRVYYRPDTVVAVE